METINKRILDLRDKLDLSQKDFGEAIGLVKSSVSNIEKGLRSVTEKHIKLICSVDNWNVNETWLRTGKGDMFIKTPETFLEQLKQKYNMSDFELNVFQKYFSLSEEKRKFFREFIYDIAIQDQVPREEPIEQIKTRVIQYYQRLASAGSGEIIFEDMPDDRIEIPDIPEYRRVAYAISVNGHSMEPLYEDGDMLLVEPTCQIDVGEIGIFILGNQAYVKQLGESELISLNQGYDNIPLIPDAKCMGRVVDKFNPR